MTLRIVATAGLIALVGCAGTDEQLESDRMGTDQAVTGEPSTTPALSVSGDQRGTATFTIVVADESQAPSAAATLDDHLAPFGARAATINGDRVVAEIADITLEGAESIDLDLTQPSSVELRPVVSPADADSEGNELLTFQDDFTLAVGPSQADHSAFGEAVAVQDASGWSISIEIADPEAWNAVAQQCFNGAPTCPAMVAPNGQLAIVVDGVIVTAPIVNQPEFADTLVVSGAFAEADATAIARAVNSANDPFEVVTTEFGFVTGS